MNCQDIGRILDSGKFGSLSASERRDAEAHAHFCRHCAPRWGVHSRLAHMPIPPMPSELEVQCRTLVAARARGNVLRFVRRQTLVLVSGFVVLAAAAAVVTVKYITPALQRTEASSVPPAVVPVISPVAPPALPATVAETPRQLPVTQIPQSDKPVQQLVQGEQEMKRTTTIAVAAAALGAAVAAEPQSIITAGSIQNNRSEAGTKSLRGSEIPMAQATWVYYMNILGSEGKASFMHQQLITRLQLDDNRYLALLAHMQAARADSEAYSASLQKSMCDRRTGFTTLERIAEELERIDREGDIHIAKLVEGAQSVLGADGKAKFDAMIMEFRNGLGVSRIDYLPRMRQMNDDVASVMSRICSG